MENKSSNTVNDNMEKEKADNERIKEYGQVTLNSSEGTSKILLLSIIGEIEGHDVLSSNTKTTKIRF